MATMWGEAATPWMKAMASDILGLLDTAYPGHPWKVHVYGDDTGGGFHIRHLEFDGKNWGINEPRAHLFASASELRKRVINMGGELLERVRLERGRRNEAEQIKSMDGVPEKDQPAQFQREQSEKRLTEEVEKVLREVPRPQALREMGA